MLALRVPDLLDDHSVFPARRVGREYQPLLVCQHREALFAHNDCFRDTRIGEQHAFDLGWIDVLAFGLVSLHG